MNVLKCIFLGVFGFLLFVALLSMVILVGSLAYETLLSAIKDIKEKLNEKHKRRTE